MNEFFAGHEVVHLPVAHCKLNPIELAWAQVKGHIKSNTKEFNLTEVEGLAWEGFATVTADRWTKLVVHVQGKVEDHYWSCDSLYEQYTSHFIIQLGGESDSDDSDDELSSDDLGSDTETESCDKTETASSYSACSCDEL